MEMVKLKMGKTYKTFLSFIGLLILIMVGLGVTYLFYDKIIEPESDIEVTGSLSINYIDGKKISVETKKNVNFSITNSGNKVVYYNIGFLKVRGNGTYKIKHEDAIITEGELKSIDEITTDYISIDVGETKVYSIEIENFNSTNLTTTLIIRDYEGKTLTFSDIILENSHPSESSLTKAGSEIATEDEGLIKGYDDIGISYYYRGNVKNNYVSFGDHLWRIVRINGDGTVRLVLDGVTDGLANYYGEDSEDFTYNNSLMKVYLDDWYDLYLKDYSDYIANTKFCNDVSYDDFNKYNSYTRILINKIPTLNCLGSSFSSNIGTLTIDEVILAGANSDESNTQYYLHNENITDSWYTMSGADGNDTTINMFMVDTTGNIKTDIDGSLFRNIRPVINLVKNIEMTGSGTIIDPYKLAN